MNKRLAVHAAALGACLAFGAPFVVAGDGPQRLVCATVEAMDCEPGASCLRGRPSEIGAPAFMRIDLEQKTIAGPQRTTPIVSIERFRDNLLLQGTEIGYGWTLALDMRSGTMAATLVNQDGAFVLFGSCTPL
ncbi:MAG: hypothetical protein ACXWUS_18250 [Burkholderiales bacterium]